MVKGDSDDFDENLNLADYEGDGDGGDSYSQEPLTEEEVQELIDDLLEVESQAANAQEALEEEALLKVEADVRKELSQPLYSDECEKAGEEEIAQPLSGDELEKAVVEEMSTYKEEWESVLDELERESAQLLEQLDGAGIDLSNLYKCIEKQVPNCCHTEAWKERTHWVGTQVSKEATKSVSQAKEYLKIHRPWKRWCGASGFLEKKIAECDNSVAEERNMNIDWGTFIKMCTKSASTEDINKHWASVYLASTPKQAAELGLKFAGVDEVEEIGDVDGSSSNPFIADAIANEMDFCLTEEQKRNFRKIKEEDDSKDDLKLHARMKNMRRRKRKREGELFAIDEESQLDVVMTREDGSTVDDNKQQELHKADPDKEKCMRNYDSEEKTSENEVTSSEVVLISSSDSGSDIDISGIGTVTVLSSDSDSVSDVDANTNSRSTKRRKNIRRILDVAELGEETKKKIAIEKERQERLRSLKVTESLMVGLGVEVPDNASSGYIINLAREEDEEAVRISPSISEKLKPHQISGIRFMWENTIQSVRKVKSGDRGMGCILAHTMGLGKTFQVIAFLYTAMRCADMRLNTALILTPVTVLLNWRHEFLKWRPSELKPLQIFMLEDVPREKRLELLMKWKTKGGVFLIGYTAFRNLALGKGKYLKDPNMAREISNVLQVGPDILVCDEAHLIKNTMADTTQALKQVKCQRRIALTGSPLQNNLMEYYCMVDFVREGYLGSCHEFRNRFQNPIENGQLADATAKDVKIMNQRSHILYKELKGFIHRMGSNIVKNDLPPKTVFVIAVKLSTLQKKLYKSFLDVHGFTKGKASGDKKSFFAGYQALAQILNHPGILQMMKENKDRSKPEDLERCLADESSGDENIEYNVISGEKPQNAKKNLSNAFVCNDWWSSLLQENNFKEVDYSGKMVLLLDILTMCSDIGDKVLVFSQSLSTLDLVEHYLSRLPCPGTNGKCWKKGKDWYRLDGRTESLERQRLVERFNEPLNKRAKCVLISTRAGSLGINLYSANRVIIVDGSWNPTYDLQAIYRVWRYGQTKPVFAYRLMAHATMEEKIYKRQVIKEGLAARVVDRQQVHRTMSRDEMLDLFDFVDEESTHVLCESGQEHVVEKPNMMGSVGDLFKQRQLPSLGASSDKVMQSLINTHKPRWIFSYHEHETLLQENEDEKLSKEEQDLAWEGYKKELKSKDACAPLNDQQKISIDPSTVRQLQSSTAQSAHDPKLVPSSVEVPENNPSTRATSHHEKCTELSHILTLRSQGTKMGCSTICGKCDREISLTDYLKIVTSTRSG